MAKCKKCGRELTDIEEFAHLAGRGDGKGLCNRCNSSIDRTVDEPRSYEAKFKCYSCGKPIQFSRGSNDRVILQNHEIL